MIFHFLKQLLLLFQLVMFLINNLGGHSKKAINEKAFIVFSPRSLRQLLHYFGRAYVLQDVTLFIAAKRVFGNVKWISPSKLSSLSNNAIVVHSVTPFFSFDIYPNENQGESNYLFYKDFEFTLLPSADECRFWENKEYMHRKFLEHNIPHPKTQVLFSRNEQISPSDLSFPLLSKIVDGNHSRGIVWHKNAESLKNLLQDVNASFPLLLQEIVDTSFDIRVVVSNGEVVYHYWRHKNTSGIFKTTSTSNGSALDLSPLPDIIKKTCEESARKLSLSVAAFDITYTVDKTGVERPIIYEVSSSFLLNPIPDNSFNGKPYLEYKKRLLKFNWQRIKQFTDLKEGHLKHYFKL